MVNLIRPLGQMENEQGAACCALALISSILLESQLPHTIVNLLLIKTIS